MGQYSKKGMYAGYDKNNKERDALDYYATPSNEVYNILKEMDFEKGNVTILEPSCGGGHMVEGIYKYNPKATIYATDIKQRPNPFMGHDAVGETIFYHYGDKYDYLSEEYSVYDCDMDNIDYVIMNPPFSVIIPFVQHSLDIAKKGVLMFGRLQFLESVARYEKIFQDNPPTDVWVYVDRVACYKNGDFSTKPSSVQAYAWFYWDKEKIGQGTNLKFIRAYEKSGK